MHCDMKICLIVLLLIQCGILTAQKLVEVKENNVTQVILPDDIDYFKGGFLPDDFLIEQIKNVLYITPVYAGVNTTNMSVVTKGGLYFSLSIQYNDTLTKFNYVLENKDAFYREPGKEKKNEDKTPVIRKTDIGMLAETILKEPGFIATNNTVRYKNFFFYLKGVYVQDSVIFIRLNTYNKSNIQFDYDYIAFYINAEKKRKSASVEQLQLFPKDSFGFINSLASGKSQEILFAFDKFTIGANKVLNIDLIERNGERNLSLKIDDRVLLDARKIMK